MAAVALIGFCAKVQVTPRTASPLGYQQYVDPSVISYMKTSKSAIRLQRNPEGNLQISVSTSKHVNAHIFLAKNVEQIRTSFIHEGKITIHMKKPAVDLMLRDGSPKDLNALVDAIRNESKTLLKPESKQSATSTSTGSTKNKRQATSTSTATSSHGLKVASTVDLIPKIESRKRGATVATSNDAENGALDHRSKRQKTEVIPPNLSDPKTSASRPNDATKKQICLDLTKSKVVKDRQAVNRMLRDGRLQPPMLKVTEKGNYPKNGLWPTLKSIEATGLSMRKIDIRMNPLKNLSSLNLSSNRISSIESLKSLTCRLMTLILDSNPIEHISPDFFLAPPLLSLTYISFKNLGLKVLPRSIVNLQRLGTLFLTGNCLVALPYNLNLMISLTRLHVNDNELKFLPATVKSLSLIHLDISGNRFQHEEAKVKQKIGNGPFPTLLELAAESLKAYNKCMIRLGFPQKVIKTTPEEVPQFLHDVMEGMKSCARCIRMVARYTLASFPMHHRHLANEVIHDNQAPTIPGKIVICDACNARARSNSIF